MSATSEYHDEEHTSVSRHRKIYDRPFACSDDPDLYTL